MSNKLDTKLIHKDIEQEDEEIKRLPDSNSQPTTGLGPSLLFSCSIELLRPPRMYIPDISMWRFYYRAPQVVESGKLQLNKSVSEWKVG